MGQIAQGIAGLITGGIMGGINVYQQKRAQEKAQALAEQQYENAKTAYETEQQERAKYNGKEPDIEGLLDENTNDRVSTDLTGGTLKNKLYRKAPALGGSSNG